jgi:DNA uptake protein ComE-like DNA-binding protein
MLEEKKVNLNKADYNEIANLRMVGDVRAHNIIDHRPYSDWDDLKQKVPSISEGMVEDIKKSGGFIR